MCITRFVYILHTNVVSGPYMMLTRACRCAHMYVCVHTRCHIIDDDVILSILVGDNDLPLTHQLTTTTDAGCQVIDEDVIYNNGYWMPTCDSTGCFLSVDGYINIYIRPRRSPKPSSRDCQVNLELNPTPSCDVV